eukprot:CAMPEP_0197291972 /NCGR_PEP_ID=MMETSP0890-20130614/20583_1 /TAXON_ID=44058 ORGANISM="Aureoumbra lagunensis, Strain CCMP1510" /NCGR_SAMPLE_ID=MMETSP0890 /ASSEMBLY_ACC=CAM_ASM_000533 /LENGTH=181 /DNA_ID=CAMNT_0042765503 /DNA_START=230 /DNA_END=771 /DNA_ORIENTATION=+
MAISFGGDLSQEVLRSCGVMSKELSILQSTMASLTSEKAREHSESQDLISDLRDLILRQQKEIQRRCERPTEHKYVQTDFEDQVQAAVAAEKSISQAARRALQKDLRIAAKQQSQLESKCEAYEAKIASLNHIIDHLEASLQDKDNIIRVGLQRTSRSSHQPLENEGAPPRSDYSSSSFFP